MCRYTALALLLALFLAGIVGYVAAQIEWSSVERLYQ